MTHVTEPLGTFSHSAIWAPVGTDSHVFTTQFVLEQRQAENQTNGSQTLGAAHALSPSSIGRSEMSTTLSGCSPGPWPRRVQGGGEDVPRTTP